MHPCGHFGQTQSWADAYLSPNHLAGLSYFGKSLQTGKSKGHISLQLKAGLWADDLLWDPSFTIGTIWNGKRGDLHPSGTRTRSQEVNYGPKLFHQLVGLHGSGPVQVELCSLTKGKQASWQRPCLQGRGYLPKRALPSHEASGDLGRKYPLASPRLSSMNHFPTREVESLREPFFSLLHAHQMCSGVRAAGTRVAPYRKIIHYYQILTLVIK